MVFTLDGNELLNNCVREPASVRGKHFPGNANTNCFTGADVWIGLAIFARVR